jgi:hypothetical protein
MKIIATAVTQTRTATTFLTYPLFFIVIIKIQLLQPASAISISKPGIMSTYFDETKAAGTTVEITFDENTTPTYGLGYWNIRGLGAPLTKMLCAAKVPFSLFLYGIVEKVDDNWTSDYFTAKPEYIKTYDAPMWNLPFCVDQENKEIICQTNAVFGYLGRACEMLVRIGRPPHSASSYYVRYTI